MFGCLSLPLIKNQSRNHQVHPFENNILPDIIDTDADSNSINTVISNLSTTSVISYNMNQ